MRVHTFKANPRAFTLIELLTVMAVIMILAALLLPVLNQARARAKRLSCVSQLRQVGVAFQSFAHDHNGQFPTEVPAGAGGSEEFTTSSYRTAGDFFFSFHHFQVLSNELVTPKLLACPADTRLPALSFAELQNSNLSYFVGLKSDYSHPNSILSGDRNLTNDLTGTTTLVRFQSDRGWRWTSELHQFKGNLLFADGHVEEKSTPALLSSSDQGLPVAELVLPSVPGFGSRGAAPAIGLALGPGLATIAGAQAADFPSAGGQSKNQPLNSVLSTPVGLQTVATTLAPDLQTVTNAGAKSRPEQPKAAVEKPQADQEPGFSFFPPVVGTTISHALSKSAWMLYLLLLLLLGTALFFWLRSAAAGRPHDRARVRAKL